MATAPIACTNIAYVNRLYDLSSAWLAKNALIIAPISKYND